MKKLTCFAFLALQIGKGLDKNQAIAEAIAEGRWSTESVHREFRRLNSMIEAPSEPEPTADDLTRREIEAVQRKILENQRKIATKKAEIKALEENNLDALIKIEKLQDDRVPTGWQDDTVECYRDPETQHWIGVKTPRKNGVFRDIAKGFPVRWCADQQCWIPCHSGETGQLAVRGLINALADVGFDFKVIDHGHGRQATPKATPKNTPVKSADVLAMVETWDRSWGYCTSTAIVREYRKQHKLTLDRDYVNRTLYNLSKIGLLNRIPQQKSDGSLSSRFHYTA